jgi:hypothetical protein
LQAAERGFEHASSVTRSRGSVSRLGLAADDVGVGGDYLVDWIERERPAVLLFADWFALRTTPHDQAEALWLSGIARRVCDICLSLPISSAYAPGRTVMQNDGNLVVYAANGSLVWSSGTGGSGHHLDVQDDGNVVIYRADGSSAWATSTL